MNVPDDLAVEVEHARLSVDPAHCRRVLKHVFMREGLELEQVTLILSGHAFVRQLNREFLDHDFETDVLAFRYSQAGSDLEGEIYVDLDTALERHNEFGESFEVEVLRYAIHGALHLAGYSDHTDELRKGMHELENRYLQEIGMR